MKAAVYTRYGPPDVVQIQDVEFLRTTKSLDATSPERARPKAHKECSSHRCGCRHGDRRAAVPQPACWVFSVLSLRYLIFRSSFLPRGHNDVICAERDGQTIFEVFFVPGLAERSQRFANNLALSPVFCRSHSRVALAG